ncbi:hypothetical protein ACE4RV_07580 [Acetobacter persici]
MEELIFDQVIMFKILVVQQANAGKSVIRRPWSIRFCRSEIKDRPFV